MVFPYDEWLVIEEKVAHQSKLRKEVRSFQRFLCPERLIAILMDRPCAYPPTLREYAKLEKDIVLAGMLKVSKSGRKIVLKRK